MQFRRREAHVGSRGLGRDFGGAAAARWESPRRRRWNEIDTATRSALQRGRGRNRVDAAAGGGISARSGAAWSRPWSEVGAAAKGPPTNGPPPRATQQRGQPPRGGHSAFAPVRVGPKSEPPRRGRTTAGSAPIKYAAAARLESPLRRRRSLIRTTASSAHQRGRCRGDLGGAATSKSPRGRRRNEEATQRRGSAAARGQP
jgi:hypothetical protein